MLREIKIEGRTVLIHEDANARRLLVQPMDARGAAELAEQELRLIAKGACGAPFSFAALPVNDWNAELSPWSAPAVYGKEDFDGKGAQTLAFITDALLPALLPSAAPCLLGGYSLAGLFSLWAARCSGCFAGVAAASPSVWFSGWSAFAAANPMRAENVYLSLGNREARTKNTQLATVADEINREYALLASQLGAAACALEWNAGGHFSEVAERTARGFLWLLRKSE